MFTFARSSFLFETEAEAHLTIDTVNAPEKTGIDTHGPAMINVTLPSPVALPRQNCYDIY